MSSLSSLCCLLVLLVSLLSVQAQQSFCDKYSMALFNATDAATETKLITAVVTRAVLGDSSTQPPVPGLVGARSPIIRVSAPLPPPPPPPPSPLPAHPL